jgi:hypothetical protein
VIKIPLVVVRRIYFDEFLNGSKTIEYRRHRPPFTERVFYPGRAVRISYRYDLGAPRLSAIVSRFEAKPLREQPDMIGFYDDMELDDEVALIHLAIEPLEIERLRAGS